LRAELLIGPSVSVATAWKYIECPS